MWVALAIRWYVCCCSGYSVLPKATWVTTVSTECYWALCGGYDQYVKGGGCAPVNSRNGSYVSLLGQLNFPWWCISSSNLGARPQQLFPSTRLDIILSNWGTNTDSSDLVNFAPIAVKVGWNHMFWMRLLLDGIEKSGEMGTSNLPQSRLSLSTLLRLRRCSTSASLSATRAFRSLLPSSKYKMCCLARSCVTRKEG